MDELPAAQTSDQSEMDHGKLFPRHVEPGAMRPRDRNVLWTVLVAAAATFTLLVVLR